MTREQILKQMDLGAKAAREKFFKIADTLHLQPKYQQYLAELETLKQQWRDMTTLPDYPNIDFPLPMPEWFPKAHYSGCWKKDIYIEQKLKHYEEMQKHKEKLKDD